MPQATITADDLHQILENWNSLASSAAGGHESRATLRTQLCGAIAIVPVRGGQTSDPAIHVIVDDLGPNGIGFIHVEPLQVDTEFAILCARPSERRKNILLRVAYCTELDDGRFRVGGKFTNVKTDRKELSADLDSDPLFRSIFG
jgi:hypothetical protein